MDWVRLKAKRLSLLALFALAMQIGLSFGHTHIVAWQADHTQVATASPATGTGPNLQDPDAICAICVTAAIAASALHAASPSLALPAEFSAVSFAPLSLRDAPRASTAAFHSRGPPSLLT